MCTNFWFAFGTYRYHIHTYISEISISTLCFFFYFSAPVYYKSLKLKSTNVKYFLLCKIVIRKDLRVDFYWKITSIEFMWVILSVNVLCEFMYLCTDFKFRKNLDYIYLISIFNADYFSRFIYIIPRTTRWTRLTLSIGRVVCRSFKIKQHPFGNCIEIIPN